MTTLFGNISKDHQIGSHGSYGWELDTVDHNDGRYEITFTRAFDEMPSAIATCMRVNDTAVAVVEFLNKEKMIV